MKILLAATSDDVQTGASHCYLDIVREFKKRKLEFVSLVPKEGDLSRTLEKMNVKTYVVGENKDVVMVIYVPMAKREQKPVYINNDIFNGTFRRNYEGDYHCTRL